MAPVLAPLLTRLDRRGADAPEADLPRPGLGGDEPVEAVRSILADVADRGDVAHRFREVGREKGLNFGQAERQPGCPPLRRPTCRCPTPRGSCWRAAAR